MSGGHEGQCQSTLGTWKISYWHNIDSPVIVQFATKFILIVLLDGCSEKMLECTGKRRGKEKA